MEWSQEQSAIIAKIREIGLEQYLTSLDADSRRWKCPVCLLVVAENPCPKCGCVDMTAMCVLDHCYCEHGIVESIETCPVCDEAICPKCGSHDVVQISRVTGYLQEVGGWNAGKRQELKDRVRYDVA
jgi:hypothetical protein